MSGIECCEVIGKIDHNIMNPNLFEHPHILGKNVESEVIASEILGDIIDNAMDIAIRNEESVARNVIGDMNDNYMPRSTKMTELPANLEKVSPLEEEVKKQIQEISNSCRNVDILPSKGIGDQLRGDEIIQTKKSHAFKSFTLEKKSRLTDLVKNSKSLFSKFLHETPRKTEADTAEEEQCMRVIDLDGTNRDQPAEQPIQRSNSNENIYFYDDSKMDKINLRKNNDAFHVQASESDLQNFKKRSMTFPKASSAREGQKYEHSVEVDFKKKWGLGSKIMAYFRRRGSSKKEAK